MRLLARHLRVKRRERTEKINRGQVRDKYYDWWFSGVCACVYWHPILLLGFQVSSDLLFCPTSLLPIPSIWVPFVSSKGACVCVKERVWFVGLFTPPPQEKETHLALSYQFWDRQNRVSTRKKTDWGSLWWQKDLSCCTLIINTVSLVHKVQDLFVQNQNCTLPAQWRCAGKTILLSEIGIREKPALRHASTLCCCHCSVVGKTLFLYLQHAAGVPLTATISRSSVNVTK